ncbi:pB475L [African swine fever virus]|uniref:PB475L n=1 Tax=African swine fever virus TaxID=10497 RepID=A0A8A1V1Z5_ASF|nr:pB475L [African swine fever virus]
MCKIYSYISTRPIIATICRFFKKACLVVCLLFRFPKVFQEWILYNWLILFFFFKDIFLIIKNSFFILRFILFILKNIFFLRFILFIRTNIFFLRFILFIRKNIFFLRVILFIRKNIFFLRFILFILKNIFLAISIFTVQFLVLQRIIKIYFTCPTPWHRILICWFTYYTPRMWHRVFVWCLAGYLLACYYFLFSQYFRLYYFFLSRRCLFLVFFITKMFRGYCFNILCVWIPALCCTRALYLLLQELYKSPVFTLSFFIFFTYRGEICYERLVFRCYFFNLLQKAAIVCTMSCIRFFYFCLRLHIRLFSQKFIVYFHSFFVQKGTTIFLHFFRIFMVLFFPVFVITGQHFFCCVTGAQIAIVLAQQQFQDTFFLFKAYTLAVFFTYARVNNRCYEVCKVYCFAVILGIVTKVFVQTIYHFFIQFFILFIPYNIPLYLLLLFRINGMFFVYCIFVYKVIQNVVTIRTKGFKNTYIVGFFLF